MTDLKFGRRPPKHAPALHLAAYLTGATPAHPAAADNLAALTSWQMLGNDQYGDCVAVTWANVRRLMTHLAGAEHYPDWAQVETVYRTQNPGFPAEDNGMDIQTLLEFLVKHGGPDGASAVCFAKVDHTNPDEVKAAIAIFGYVWTGINVQAAQMDEFDSGQPWDYIPGSPDDGAHSVVTGGYGAGGRGALGGDECFITWAQETSFTDAYWAREVEEAWVVIWPEHLGSRAFLAGVDQAALAADYTSLTGRPFPVQPAPVPPPAPQPSPTPGVDLAAAVAEWWTQVEHWAVDERHVSDNRHAAQSAQALARAAGLMT